MPVRVGYELTNNLCGDIFNPAIQHNAIFSNQLIMKIHIQIEASPCSMYDEKLREAGFEPHELDENNMMSLRVQAVKRMLLEEEGLALAEIAWRLDYNSIALLSAQFKKVTGLTTSEFKRMHSLKGTFTVVA
jgi:hypothetical protein